MRSNSPVLRNMWWVWSNYQLWREVRVSHYHFFFPSLLGVWAFCYFWSTFLGSSFGTYLDLNDFCNWREVYAYLIYSLVTWPLGANTRFCLSLSARCSHSSARENEEMRGGLDCGYTWIDTLSSTFVWGAASFLKLSFLYVKMVVLSFFLA